jgi:hypothetical protein
VLTQDIFTLQKCCTRTPFVQQETFLRRSEHLLWDSKTGRLSHDPGASGSPWLGQLVVPTLGDVISMMLYSVACLHSLYPDFVGWVYIKRPTAVAE